MGTSLAMGLSLTAQRNRPILALLIDGDGNVLIDGDGNAIVAYVSRSQVA
jgi:hypothetical protein